MTPLDGVRRIVFLGASITEAGGFITKIDQVLKHSERAVELIKAGIGGNKSTQMRDRFQTDVLDRKPDLVTINTGLNDVWHSFRDAEWTHRVPTGDSGCGVDIETHEEAIRSMIEMALGAGIRVLFLSPTGIYEDLECDENRRLAGYVEVQRRVTAEMGVGFVDMFAVFHRVLAGFQAVAGPGALLLTTDGVHFNKAGDGLMAAGWLQAMGVPLPNDIEPK
ncbi:MAG: SGNH/GDSL hydrolase family protein [Armatimonadetes bacterium]|nr:SGNH/GDSL hydrolase family protein [Armatimonadota bacterium]